MVAVLTTLLVSLALAGCGGGEGGAQPDTGDDRTLTVLGAASLTESFTELGERFEADHPGVDVRLSFDSSATLAEQVVQGAPADVLATADEQTMQRVVDEEATAAPPQVFATNRLQLAVPVGNPAGISRLADLEQPGVTYVVCVDSAPCGRLTATVLAAAGIEADPVSEEPDVKAVLAKVQLDEADAGLVYTTDVVAAGDAVESVEVPSSAEDLNRYPVAPLAGASDEDLAQAFVDLVRSPEGQQVLARAGFGAP